MKTLFFIFTLLFYVSFAISQSCIIANYPISGNANDISGNNYHGTTFNVVLDTNRFGNTNSSYSFNGSSSYIDLPSDFDLNTRSINLWFNAKTIDAIDRHIYISDNSGLSYGSTQLIVYEDAGTQYIRFTTGLSAGMLSVPVSENTWHMATIARGADSTIYYLNGTKVGSHVNGNQHSTSGHSTAMLGTSRLMDRYFDGLIDEVTIYDCQLTPTQVDSLFKIEDGPCIIAHYPFTGNANDIGPNAFDGTPNNVTLTQNRFGAPDNAYAFDGTASYIELPEDFDLPVRSINLWFNANTIDASYRHIYVSDHAGTTNGSTQITVYNLSSVDYIRFTTGSIAGMTSVPINQKTWYMATLVRDIDSTYYYLNGARVGLHVNDIQHSTSGSTNALLGTSRLFDRYFDGSIDDVQIFDCALEPTEIETMFDITSIEEKNGMNVINVFPNPNEGQFNINIPLSLSGCTITVFDSYGNCVYMAENNRSGILSVAIGNCASGLYYLRMQNKDTSATGVFVVQ